MQMKGENGFRKKAAVKTKTLVKAFIIAYNISADGFFSLTAVSLGQVPK